MIEKLKNELAAIEDGIEYMEATDMAWSSTYTKMCKQRRILQKAIRKLEKLEVHTK